MWHSYYQEREGEDEVKYKRTKFISIRAGSQEIMSKVDQVKQQRYKCIPQKNRGNHQKNLNSGFCRAGQKARNYGLVSSVSRSCLTLCDPMNLSTPGLPVHHQLPESTQTHVHRVGDAIQPSHPLSSPSSPALNLSHHRGLWKWVSSSHQVDKVLEFQLQHQSFQWTPRTDLL